MKTALTLAAIALGVTYHYSPPLGIEALIVCCVLAGLLLGDSYGRDALTWLQNRTNPEPCRLTTMLRPAPLPIRPQTVPGERYEVTMARHGLDPWWNDFERTEGQTTPEWAAIRRADGRGDVAS